MMIEQRQRRYSFPQPPHADNPPVQVASEEADSFAREEAQKGLENVVELLEKIQQVRRERKERGRENVAGSEEK